MKIYGDGLIAALKRRGVKAIYGGTSAATTLNIGNYDPDTQCWPLILGPHVGEDELHGGVYFDPKAIELYLGPDDDGVSPVLTVEPDCTVEQLAEVIAEWISTGVSPVTESGEDGFHQTHCCPVHGCKYGKSYCLVVAGRLTPTYPANNGCEACEEDARTKSRLPEKEFEVREATGLRRDEYRWELAVRDQHVETIHGLNPNDLVRLSRAVEEFMRDPSA